MVNNYKLTFVGEGVPEPLMLEFSDKDINLFDVHFESKFAYAKSNFLADIDSELVKIAIIVEFTSNTDNFERVAKVFSELNKQIDVINEVIVYKNDTLYCDLKNIINVSIQASVRDNSFTLAIIEGA